MNGMVIVFDSKKLNFECIDSMIIVQCFFQTADSNFNRMACAAFFDIFFQLIIVRQHLYAVKCVRLKFSVKSKVFCQKNGSFEISAPFFSPNFNRFFFSFPFHQQHWQSFLIFSFLLTACNGYRVLYVAPLNAKSHFFFMESFVRALLERKHHVTFLTGTSMQHLKLANYTEILVDPPFDFAKQSQCASNEVNFLFKNQNNFLSDTQCLRR